MTPEQDARLREEVGKLAERMAVSSHACTQHCEYREDCTPMIDRAAGAIAAILLPYAQAAEERAARAEAQLPEGMKGCTIRFIECEKGHGRLTATNWIDHGCDTCERDALQQRVAQLEQLVGEAAWRYCVVACRSVPPGGRMPGGHFDFCVRAHAAAPPTPGDKEPSR